jgi:hypothetical protein
MQVDVTRLVGIEGLVVTGVLEVGRQLGIEAESRVDRVDQPQLGCHRGLLGSCDDKPEWIWWAWIRIRSIR